MSRYPLFLKLSLVIFIFGVVPAVLFIIFLSFYYENALEDTIELIRVGDGASAIKMIDSLSGSALINSTIFLFVTSVILLGGTYIVTKTITSTINHIVAAIRRLQRDEYDFEIPGTSKDELGILAQEFNVFLRKLREVREREKALSQEKSHLISITAHQLRTPLAAVKWSLSMAQDPEMSITDCGELFRESLLHIERMIKLITDVLEVSKIEEGRFGTVLVQANIQPILASIVQSLTFLAQRKNVSIEFISDEAPDILCDKERLRLAFENIIENAIIFSKKGGKVTMAMQRFPKMLRVTIEDRGIGIPAQELSKIFNKFSRASNAIRIYPEGFGLGLFTAKNIIEAHGGTLSIDSKEQEGTIVTMQFPLDIPKQEKPPFQEFVGG